MASPGELVKLIAACTGEDEPTVSVHDRNLVIAGLRSKSGRGRSAAKVTARDAACILTALLGSAKVRDSVDTVHRYEASQEAEAREIGHHKWAEFVIPEMAALPLSHSFVDALEALIQITAEHRLFGLRHLHIHVRSPATHARITMACERGSEKGLSHIQTNYGPSGPPPAWMLDKTLPVPATPAEAPRLKRWVEMSKTPVLYIGALLANELHLLPPLPAREEAN